VVYDHTQSGYAAATFSEAGNCEEITASQITGLHIPWPFCGFFFKERVAPK
jgi:hypothetical protein